MATRLSSDERRVVLDAGLGDALSSYDQAEHPDDATTRALGLEALARFAGRRTRVSSAVLGA